MRTLQWLSLFFAFVAAIIYSFYGAISPCGILKSEIRQHDSLAAILPDSVLDFGFSAQYNNPSQGKCLALLLNLGDAPSPNSEQKTVAVTQQEQELKDAQRREMIMFRKSNQSDTGDCFMGSCFREYTKSISTEKPGVFEVHTRIEHICGAMPKECAVIEQSFSSLPQEAKYRVRCQMPSAYIEQVLLHGNRVPEPNPTPTHATRSMDRLWSVICTN